MNTQRISDAVRIVDVKATYGAAATGTAYFDMSKQNAVVAVVFADVVGTSLDAKVQQATDNSGTGVKDVSGLAITQITSNDEGAVIELYADSLDLANDFNHARILFTTVGATSVASCTVMTADQERTSPLVDSAKIVEIIQDA